MRTQWEEPGRFRRALERAEGKQFPVGRALAVAGMTTLVMFASIAWHRKPLFEGSWPLTITVCFVPAVCVLVVVGIGHVAPAKVVVNDHGIARSTFQGVTIETAQCPWEQIDGAETSEYEVGDERFPVVHVRTTAGTWPIGLSPKTDLRRVRDLFEQNGKPFDDNLPGK